MNSRKINKGARLQQAYGVFGDGQIFRGTVMWTVQDTNMVKIRTASGGLYDAYVGQPFQGGASGITGMPETGAVGIFAMTGESYPVAISWLPSSQKWSPRYQHVAVDQDSLGTNAENLSKFPYVGHKHRIIQPGQVSMYSKHGADLDLNEDATLINSMGNTFRLRSADQSANLTSPLYRGVHSGVIQYSGIVVRNHIDVLGPDRVGLYADTVPNSDGSFTTHIGGQFSPIKEMASEYRVEARGFATQDYDPTEDNQFIPSDNKVNPDVEFTLANNIGNDPQHPNYGKFLRPQIFTGPGVHGGQIIQSDIAWRPVLSSPGENGENIRTEGTSWSLRIASQNLAGYGSFMAMDKHGVLHEHLGASYSASQYGISRETVGKGAKIEYWGANGRGISWEAMHSGSVLITAGRGSAPTGTPAYSWRLNAVGPTFESHNFGSLDGFNDFLTDLDDEDNVVTAQKQLGYGYIKKVGGHYRAEVLSGRYEILSNGYTVKSSTAVFDVQGYISLESSSSIDVVATSRIALQTAQTLKMSATNLTEAYSLGAKRTVVAGGESTTILVGGRADIINGVDSKVVTGASTLTATGILALSSGASSFVLDTVSSSAALTTAGTISLTAATSVTVSAPSISLNAASVILGTGVQSPVLTVLTHQCLVTGLLPPPVISGSKVVMAAS